MLEDDNFKLIIERTKQQLGATVAIRNYLNENKIKIEESELKNYFISNKDDYIFPVDVYVINIVYFEDIDNAVSFRRIAIFDGWKKAENNYDSDASLINKSSRELVKLSDLQSKKIIRVIKLLGRGEISPVIETEHNNFVIVQLLDKIKQGSEPKFNYIKEKVADTYLQIKQRELVKGYIDSLLANSNVKIY